MKKQLTILLIILNSVCWGQMKFVSGTRIVGDGVAKPLKTSFELIYGKVQDSFDTLKVNGYTISLIFSGETGSKDLTTGEETFIRPFRYPKNMKDFRSVSNEVNYKRRIDIFFKDDTMKKIIAIWFIDYNLTTIYFNND